MHEHVVQATTATALTDTVRRQHVVFGAGDLQIVKCKYRRNLASLEQSQNGRRNVMIYVVRMSHPVTLREQTRGYRLALAKNYLGDADQLFAERVGVPNSIVQKIRRPGRIEVLPYFSSRTE
jgi:hypothetical protein